MIKKRWYAPLEKAAEWGLHIGAHLLVTLVLIAGITLLHHLLKDDWGDPKLYDLVPLRYVLDTLDVSLLAAFIVYGTISAVEVFRRKDEEA